MNFKKILINVLKYLVFLSLGVFLFLKVTEEYKIKDLFAQLKEYNIWYILIAISFNILSNISRAMRWNLLLKPIGYKVNIFNAFLSVQIMYLANFFVPRGGEIARCGILTRTDKVPFAKAVGTVVVERMIDALTLLLLSFIVFLTQFTTLKAYILDNIGGENNDFGSILKSKFVILAVVILGIAGILIILFRKNIKQSKLYKKILRFYFSLLDGLKSIAKVERPYLLILHTIFIYVMWFFMMITFFKGFAPTSNLGLMPVLTVFVMSSLSMILPVPAGMGAFHFAIASSLVLYGVDFEIGGVLAFIMHTSTNLYLNLFGLLSFIYFLYFYFIQSKNNTRSL